MIGASWRLPGDKREGAIVKPSELEIEGTREAVTDALQVLGVNPEEATVYVAESPPHDDQARLILATPIGLLVMTDTVTSRFEDAWQLTTEVIPWRDLQTQVTVHTLRGKRVEGTETEWHVKFPDRDDLEDISTSSYAERKRPTGAPEFIAAALKWIEPLRM